jgi:type IV pilus assembly protein PilC
MLSAGLTAARALSVIERQTKNKYLKKIVQDISTDIKSGKSLHEALQKYDKVFSKLFIAMAKVGEESGTLSQSLLTVAKQMDASFTLQKKIKGAMMYPSIIVMAVIIIGVLMMIYVVPTLSATFLSLGAELPTATKVIIATSTFMAENAIATILATIAFFAGVIMFLRSKLGGTVSLAVALRLPIIGELVQETFSARAARTLSSLLSSGVQMLNAIDITFEVVGDNVFGKVVKEAGERVKKGEPLSSAFVEASKLYPVFFSDMILVGEETGKVSELLTQIAQYYETDVEERTKDLSTIIEPMLMLFIGVFVGIFALAMITPIYSLSEKI